MKNPEIKRLFEPIKIGNVQIKNRIKMPALAVGYAENGFVSEKLKDFYEERAKGGTGLIGIAITASRLAEFSPFTGVWDDKFIPGMTDLAKLLHKYGAKIFAQFGVGYGWAFGPYDDIIAPSPSGASPTEGRQELAFRLGAPSRTIARTALTREQTRMLIEGYGDGARRCKEAGWDMVEIMLGAGYMLCHWLSPLTNKRTDEYGGSLENRLRIVTEIITDMKKKAGKDFPIICKIATSDLVFQGGYHLEDAKEMAKILEKAGIEAFDQVPAWHESTHPAMNWYAPDGAWIHLAEALKKVVKVPVATGMRIPDPVMAEAAIKEGRADLVVWGRPLIAEPHLANLVKEGKFDDIRTCIVCSKCVEMVDTPIACTINAQAGREKELAIKKAAKPKKVIVVGSGPAGMEAATVAAKRGHDVTIYDQGSKLGGQLNAAIVPLHKDKMASFLKYEITQLKKAGVKVVLNKKVKVKDIIDAKPDAVIVATGANPIIPDIEGLKWPSVVSVLDILSGKKEAGNNVVIIGGGLVGCETGELLATKGKKVTILEIMPRFAMDVGRLTRWNLLGDLRKMGVKMEGNVDSKEITFLGVRGVKKGEHVFYDADTVIIATGMRGDNSLAKELEGKVPKVIAVGDCIRARKIMEAVEEGFRAGLKV
ncbi:MAG: NAD(P)/FAD-dependent oxidoreductase [Dehalococcoidia bacterium]|nr:NAD(P)/FAD-dependent oxidoreductase [Dehalococcoidia bacterium]MDZ4246638.1 NAD(P)/FAD-dependent oxidoreductase [Dehalococcoidia bacterium]